MATQRGGAVNRRSKILRYSAGVAAMIFVVVSQCDSMDTVPRNNIHYFLAHMMLAAIDHQRTENVKIHGQKRTPDWGVAQFVTLNRAKIVFFYNSHEALEDVTYFIDCRFG